MLTGFVAWLANKLGVSTLIVNIGLVAILCGGFYIWLKYHDARLYEEVYRKAELDGIEKQKKVNEKEWADILKKIEDDKKIYEKKIAEANQQTQRLLAENAELSRKYREQKAKTTIQIKEIPIYVEKIPKSELVDTIRVASGSLTDPPITNIEKTGVFSETEERLILTQLKELEIRRTQINDCETALSDNVTSCAKINESYKLSLSLEQENTKTAQKERDVYVKERDFYKSAYDTCKTKRTTGCWVAKIFTIGLWPCR